MTINEAEFQRERNIAAAWAKAEDKVKALELQLGEEKKIAGARKQIADNLETERDELRVKLTHAEADLLESNRLNSELVEALQHMKMCGSCAEDSWNLCEGGKQAQAALDKATGTGKRKPSSPNVCYVGDSEFLAHDWQSLLGSAKGFTKKCRRCDRLEV